MLFAYNNICSRIGLLLIELVYLLHLYILAIFSLVFIFFDMIDIDYFIGNIYHLMDEYFIFKLVFFQRYFELKLSYIGIIFIIRTIHNIGWISKVILNNLKFPPE